MTSLLRVATLLVPIVAFALQPATSFADTGTLDCNNLPGGLQYYLTTATAGSSFTLTGTCTGTFTINKPMTLQGGTLKGSGSAPVLTIAPGSGSVTLSQMKITGGTGVNGDDGTPVLSISGKPAGPGGIDIKNGNVTLQYSTVSGNSGGNGGDGASVSSYAAGNGGRGGTGGVLIEGGTVNLNGDIISENVGGQGGNGYELLGASPGNGGDSGSNGIQVNSGTVTIANTSIKNNLSSNFNISGRGGPSLVSPGSGGRGSAGGITVGGGTVDVIDSTVSGNGGGAGGPAGSYLATSGYGTEGTGGPGGLLVGGGSLNLYNSTVTTNFAGRGGGNYNVGQPIGPSGDGAGTVVGGSLTLTYTTVAGNVSRAGFVDTSTGGVTGTAGVDGLGNRGSGSISLKASILQEEKEGSGSGQGACAGTINNDGGYNVFGTLLGSPDYQACTLTNYDDINQFTDSTHRLNLGTLGDTVNTTGVVPLNAGSVAIGRLPASICQAGLPGPSGSGFPNPSGTGDLILHDQRDVGRTPGPCDAGSFQTLMTPSVKLRSYYVDDTGVSDSDGITNNNRPGFLGRIVAPGGFPVTLYLDGQRLGTTTSWSSSYGFLFRPTTTIPDGTHTISATVTDPDNGLTTSMSASSSFVVVTTLPTITVAPANQSISSDGYYSPDTGSTTLSVNAGGSAVDALTGLSCTEANSTSVFSLPSGGTSLSGTFSLPAGAHSITCSASDIAGNLGTLTRTLNVRAATTTRVQSSLATSVYGQSVTFTATVSSSGGTPTGTVAFSTAAKTISGCGAQPLNSTGVATCTTSALGAGTDQTITATYGAHAAFSGSTGTTSHTVLKATPVITWSTPADITYGTALSGTQLNATSSVPGTFAYVPSSGTVLHAGSGQLLSTTFTPTDTGNYAIASKNITLTVLKADQTISFDALTGVIFGHAPLTLAATASSGLPVGYSVPGTDPCTLSGVSLTITGAGTCHITASQPGSSDYTAAPSVAQNLSIAKAPTTLTARASQALIAAGQLATLSATLTANGGGLSGKTVTLTLAGQSCSGTTTATGGVSCTIPAVTAALGPAPITGSFAEDVNYLTSGSSQPALVYAALASGSFVLGDTTAATTGSTPVTYSGSQWGKFNDLSGGAAPSSFKGFASSVGSSGAVCGGTWTTEPGNSSSPPASVPSYMAVVVSSHITKSGPAISGDITKLVIVQTDLRRPGTGTIVATLTSCQP